MGTTRRSHSWANVAPALRTLLGQFNEEYPERKATRAGTDADGIWPSKAHTKANPYSSHEYGNALDIDDDLSGINGVPPQVTPEMASLLSMDPRCYYTIHDNILYKAGLGRPYRGSNPHTGHVHITVFEHRRNEAHPWDIGTEEVKDMKLDCVWITPSGTTANLTVAKKRAASANLWAEEVTPGELWVHARRGKKADDMVSWLLGRNFTPVPVTLTYVGSFEDIVYEK